MSARTLARFYVGTGLLVVLALAFLTPPFQVPDEQQHFFRAYQLSEFGLRSTVQDGQAGAALPSALIELSERFLGGRELHTGHVLRRRTLADTLRLLPTPLEPGRREFIAFTGAAAYWPGAYLPQAAGIAAGRLAGLGPLGLLFAARLCNGIVAVLLTGAALRLLPAGRSALFVAALLPMTLYEMASCSADALTIATALLFTAIAAGAVAAGRWSTGRLAAAALAAAVFCPLKPVYAPLLLLAAPWRPLRDPRAWRAQATLLGAGVGTALLWMAANPVISAAPFADVDPARQLGAILAEPWRLPQTLAATVERDGLAWAEQTVGVLGWLAVHLERPMLAIPPLLLALCALLPRDGAWQPSGGRRAWLAAIALACAGLILLALYLLWTPVGAPAVEGAQGRYLLPLAGVLAILIGGAWPRRARSAPLIGAAIRLLGLGEALLTVGFVARAFAVL